MDPYLTLVGSRKAILEFDLSDLRPNFVYEYTFKFYVSYVGTNEQRSVTASYVNETDFSFDEDDVTWDNFGKPSVASIGWFSIWTSDEDTSVEIPLGTLPDVEDDKLILVLELLDLDDGGGGGGGSSDKWDLCSKQYPDEFGSAEADKVSTLIATPQV
jgi:hypothetical protein